MVWAETVTVAAIVAIDVLLLLLLSLLLLLLLFVLLLLFMSLLRTASEVLRWGTYGPARRPKKRTGRATTDAVPKPSRPRLLRPRLRGPTRGRTADILALWLCGCAVVRLCGCVNVQLGDCEILPFKIVVSENLSQPVDSDTYRTQI